MKLNPIHILIFVWFGVSVLAEVFGSVALFFWLLAKGAKPSWMRYGVPGYLEDLYGEHQERAGKDPRRLLIIRRAIAVSLILSLISLVIGIGTLAGHK